MELLAQHYTQSGQFIQAAKIYNQLADTKYIALTEEYGLTFIITFSPGVSAAEIDANIHALLGNQALAEGQSMPLQSRITYLTKARVWFDDHVIGRHWVVMPHCSDDAAYSRPALVAGNVQFLQDLRSKRDVCSRMISVVMSSLQLFQNAVRAPAAKDFRRTAPAVPRQPT